MGERRPHGKFSAVSSTVRPFRFIYANFFFSLALLPFALRGRSFALLCPLSSLMRPKIENGGLVLSCVLSPHQKKSVAAAAPAFSIFSPLLLSHMLTHRRAHNKHKGGADRARCGPCGRRCPFLNSKRTHVYTHTCGPDPFTWYCFAFQKAAMLRRRYGPYSNLFTTVWTDGTGGREWVGGGLRLIDDILIKHVT